MPPLGSRVLTGVQSIRHTYFRLNSYINQLQDEYSVGVLNDKIFISSDVEGCKKRPEDLSDVCLHDFISKHKRISMVGSTV